MKPASTEDKSIFRKCHNVQGVALLLTLAVMTLLVTTVITLNKRVRESRAFPAAISRRATLTHMASSGIQAAMTLLIQDKRDSAIDSIQENWADPLFLETVSNAIPFETGSVTLTIRDELAKIQVNALVSQPNGQNFNPVQKRMWDAFLEFLKEQLKDTVPDLQPETILSSIKDWLDGGEGDMITGISGAESDYYQGLDPPYFPKNGPITHLGELAFIKGFTPDLITAMGGIAGLSEYVTVFGVSSASASIPEFKGRININTADLPVLAALMPVAKQNLAKAIYDFRSDRTGNAFLHDLSDPTWYRDAPGCSGLRIDPERITLESDCFRIEATAVIGPSKLTIIAIVRREQNGKTGQWACRVLSWQLL